MCEYTISAICVFTANVIKLTSETFWMSKQTSRRFAIGGFLIL